MELKYNQVLLWLYYPVGSIYGIFTHIWLDHLGMSMYVYVILLSSRLIWDIEGTLQHMALLIEVPPSRTVRLWK